MKGKIWEFAFIQQSFHSRESDGEAHPSRSIPTEGATERISKAPSFETSARISNADNNSEFLVVPPTGRHFFPVSFSLHLRLTFRRSALQ